MSEKEEEKSKLSPLYPTDPSQGIILAQGHFVFHFALFITSIVIVEMGTPDFYCYYNAYDGLSKPGDWLRLKKREALIKEELGFGEDEAINPYNQTVIYLRWMHLICAIFQLVSNIDVTERLNSNNYIVKKLLVFVTVPYYIAAILGSIFIYDFSRIPEAMSGDDVLVYAKRPLCFSSYQGNVLTWIKIEVSFFYVNLLVLIFYLARTRFVSAEDSVSKSASSQTIKDKVLVLTEFTESLDENE